MNDIPSFLRENSVAKRKIFKTKAVEPKYENLDKLTGQEYARFKDHALQYYRIDCNQTDYKQWTIEYMESIAYGDWKDKLPIIKKNPDREFNSTLGGICRMRLKGVPDEYEPYKVYWRELPGTMGEAKPLSVFVNKQLEELFEKGKLVQEIKEEEKKKEEEKNKNVYKPSIQERINMAIPFMTEVFEQAIDDFISGKRLDFKDIQPLRHLKAKEVKQPHAKIIQDLYEAHLIEMRELINPPEIKTEQDKDWHQQLKDGYSHYDKRQVKKLHDFYHSICVACSGIIAERKANRKPRKLSKKAPEQVVKKLKYKIADDKYGASIEAHKFVLADMLVIFNCKNRKLGVYYTSNEDPLGQKRDGTGLYLKGQTIQRYSEEKSVWKVLRKPQEQLEEVRNLNTRRKFENWFDKITTTPTKMNGRINPETLLIGAY